MVNKMSIKQGIKNLLKNPFVFGASAGMLVVLFNISIASLAEGSFEKGYQVFLTNGIFVYLIPLAVSVQMWLFRYHRNITTGNIAGSEKMGMAGSATSSLTMVTCCLHHVSDILPSIGLILAASSFLILYKDSIIIIGLLANVAGSIYIARAIIKDKSIIAKVEKIAA
jgi:ABC-type sugar transport system permease subunit